MNGITNIAPASLIPGWSITNPYYSHYSLPVPFPWTELLQGRKSVCGFCGQRYVRSRYVSHRNSCIGRDKKTMVCRNDYSECGTCGMTYLRSKWQQHQLLHQESTIVQSLSSTSTDIGHCLSGVQGTITTSSTMTDVLKGGPTTIPEKTTIDSDPTVPLYRTSFVLVISNACAASNAPSLSAKYIIELFGRMSDNVQYGKSPIPHTWWDAERTILRLESKIADIADGDVAVCKLTRTEFARDRKAYSDVVQKACSNILNTPNRIIAGLRCADFKSLCDTLPRQQLSKIVVYPIFATSTGIIEGGRSGILCETTDYQRSKILPWKHIAKAMNAIDRKCEKQELVFILNICYAYENLVEAKRLSIYEWKTTTRFIMSANTTVDVFGGRYSIVFYDLIRQGIPVDESYKQAVVDLQIRLDAYLDPGQTSLGNTHSYVADSSRVSDRCATCNSVDDHLVGEHWRLVSGNDLLSLKVNVVLTGKRNRKKRKLH